MHLLFLSYHCSPDIQSPEEWFERIRFYKGWGEILAENNTVTRVDQINYKGALTHRGIHYHFIKNLDKNRFLPKNLHKLVRSLKPDIVVISSFLYPIQLIQLRNSLGKNVKFLVQNHAERPFSGLKKWIQNLASRLVDVFLFTNPDTGIEWVRSGNIQSENKIEGLPEVSSNFYPVDKNISKNKTGSSGLPIFLWVGRLNQNKDPVTAVKAFLKFGSEHPQARLYMIYQTEELLPELKNQVKDSESADCIVFVGLRDHKILIDWYNSADFFLSASHYEGSGTALCEALSCGCIPIVTNIPPFRIIADSVGFYFEPGNEVSLLISLREAMKQNSREKRIQAIEHFKNELSFESIAKKFYTIVSSL
jgi:glycosyltransferase involved in cell wall biosynthesis